MAVRLSQTLGVTTHMAAFKHHSFFTDPRKAETYLFPHVCLACRKSFKKPLSLTRRRCSECKAELIQLSRKFKAPKSRDTQQWAKVRFLVEHGFSFYSVYERTALGEIRVQYPRTLEEAREFVKGKKREATAQSRLPRDRTYGLRDLPVLRRPAGAAVPPNPSIERTLSGLRPPSASHVKR